MGVWKCRCQIVPPRTREVFLPSSQTHLLPDSGDGYTATMTFCNRWVSCFLLCFALLLSLIGARPAHAQGIQIQAIASPSRLVYGADNTIMITVSVRDNSGRAVEDGTAVFFNTTLGTLPTVAYTQGGKVGVIMGNTTGPGLAIITVTVNNARQTLQVEYLGKGGKATAQPKRISYRIKAKQIYYSVDQRVFDLKDQTQLITPNYTIAADAMQLNVDQGIICAQQNITITANKKVVTARNLHMTLSMGTGTIITADPDITYKTFTLPALEVKDDTSAHNLDYVPISPLPTHTWILCHEALFYPGDQVQFYQPRFYLDNFDHCLYSLPYHVLNLRNQVNGAFFNSDVSITSDAGLNIDFPIYYAANDTHVGSLHLLEVARGSSGYSGSSGLELNVEEAYRVGDSGEGGLFLDDLARDTRSVTWNHTHDFGPTHVSLTGGYDRYTDSTPYTERAGVSLARAFGGCSASLNTNWSSFDQNQDGVAEFTFGFPSLRIGKTGLGLGFTPYLNLHHNATTTTVASTGPKTTGTTTDSTTTDLFTQGLRTGLTFPSLRFLGGAITTNVSDDIAHDSDGVMTNYVDTGVSYAKQLSAIFSTSLTYSLSATHSSDPTVTNQPSQRLSYELSGHGGMDWNMAFYSNYGLEEKLLYNSLNANYYLPWWRTKDHKPRAVLQYTGSMSSGQLSSMDSLFSVGYVIGAYSLMLHYSPSGNNAVSGIGSGTGKRWAIELVRQAW